MCYTYKTFEGQNFCSFCGFHLNHERFQSASVFVDVVLMQTQKFFSEYSNGDLTTNVLTLKGFVLSTHITTMCEYYMYTILLYMHIWYLAIAIYVCNYVASTYVRLHR